MNDFVINYAGTSIEVEGGGFGCIKLDLGRPATGEDAKTLDAMMNLGARMYANKIKQARRKVDDLIDWQAP
jgi:hypothetical protein